MQKSMTLFSLCALVLGSCQEPSTGMMPDLGTPEPPVTTINIKCDHLTVDKYIADNNIHIDYEKELMITSLDVVNDPCRTEWGGKDDKGNACAPELEGHWTFWYLMLQAAGDTPVEDFIKDWLMSWTTDQMVNGHIVKARPRISNILNTDWAKNNFKKEGAPFRLLAIINRIDLAGLQGPYVQAPLGEGRMIFGFTDSAGGPLQAVVSLEYQLAPSSTQKAKDWAKMWRDLEKLDKIGRSHSPYNIALQKITDMFVDEYSNTTGSNHQSSLLRVRTNELSFGMDRLWQMREYVLQDGNAPCRSNELNKCLLKLQPLTQTPDISYNGSDVLDSWIIKNKISILNQNHIVDETYSYMGKTENFLAGSIELGQSSIMNAWNYPSSQSSLMDADVRHLFSVETCNGCHYAETGTLNFHISPRYKDEVAILSKFVEKVDFTNPAAQQPPVVDPFSSQYRAINEPRRRACEMIRILSGEKVRYSPPDNSQVIK